MTNYADNGEIYFSPTSGIVAERVVTHSAKDVDITAKLRVTLNNASGGVFALRSDAEPGTYLGVTFGTTGWDADAFRIAKFSGSTWTRTDLVKITSPFPSNTAYYWLRFQVLTNPDGSITARAMGWEDGSSPPPTWQLVTPPGWDDSLFRNRVGRFGVLGGPGQLGRRIRFDNFEAKFWEVAQ